MAQVKALMVAALLLCAACQPAPEQQRVSTAPAPAPRGPLSDREEATVQLFERAAPSVVQVVSHVTVQTPFSVADQEGTGTGFVWDDAGYIVTNNHVVENSDQI